jgi:hypothetical protein
LLPADEQRQWWWTWNATLVVSAAVGHVLRNGFSLKRCNVCRLSIAPP